MTLGYTQITQREDEGAFNEHKQLLFFPLNLWMQYRAQVVDSVFYTALQIFLSPTLQLDSNDLEGPHTLKACSNAIS